MSGGADSPRRLTPREAVERYINAKRAEVADASAKSYYYRLKLFVEWCEGQRIDDVSELTGWEFDTYEGVRRAEDVTPMTLQSEMKTLKNFIEYLERIEVVEQGLAEKVHIPNVAKIDQFDETMLKPADAIALLSAYREKPSLSHTRSHVLLELAWHTGARVGGLRSLDLRDYETDGPYVEFRHRPDTDTPLKNGLDGERPVGFPQKVDDILDQYIQNVRPEIHDDHGREPLITSHRGRPAPNTMRVWFYKATFPCLHRECPHGKDPETCEYRNHTHASKCPSVRSPHQIRTGSISWQRDLGFPKEVVSERVNASLDVIEKYYDHQSALKKMRNRRMPYIDRMSFNNDQDGSNN